MVILETYRKKLSMFVQKGQSPESQAFSSNSFSDRQYDSVGRVKYSTEPWFQKPKPVDWRWKGAESHLICIPSKALDIFHF